MISIIIPVYNTAQYLDQCLESVASQSYTDWECIVIDDGSIDNSGKICDNWGKKDNRFVIIHQNNQGVSAARNHGLERSKGEYICFIDSDDWVGENYLVHLISESKEVDLVVSGLARIFSDQTVKKAFVKKVLNYELSADSNEGFFSMLKEDCFYGPVCKLYKTDIIINNNICFPVGCSYGEDLLFNFQYLEYTNRISCGPFVDYYYRILENGTLTKRKRIDRFENDYRQWRVVESFCRRKGQNSAEVNVYLGLKLWGIIYDSIFDKNNQSLSLLRKILSIKEIPYLKESYKVFTANKWIKEGILHRCFFMFFVLKKLRLI